MNASRKSGFTIVELLIIIVVVGILAAISIVAYNGIQQRARDTERRAELGVVERYVKLYIADNGAVPHTTSGCYRAKSSNLSGCEAMNLLPDISKYIADGKLPVDPKNDATSHYIFAKGMKRSSDGLSLVGGTVNDYAIVGILESTSTPSFDVAGTNYNYIHASS